MKAEAYYLTQRLEQLRQELDGEVYWDMLQKVLYATDASAYREVPVAVAFPKTVEDIRALIRFAVAERKGLIPRCAGTSLAGQVVGNGIVVDLSRYFTGILELNKEEKWVRVQPGVIRDVLNIFLRPHGLFFAPETSTANRAMIGGMVGNNSCGANSIVYGTTREHVLEVKAMLSDGSEVCFGDLDVPAFMEKCGGESLESRIYKGIYSLLKDPLVQQEIEREFPKKSIKRRNTGYAIDVLLEMAPFNERAKTFNFSKLIAGSEGTLAFITEIKLKLEELPAREKGLLCIHFNTIQEALLANVIAMQYAPDGCELIDHYILGCTKDNIEQRKNRFFLLGDPGAVLIVEFNRSERGEIVEVAEKLTSELRELGLGYHYPLLFGDDCNKIWNLRKAGLGLLSNLPGDSKAVPVIEDTAVDLSDLVDYIGEFNEILRKHDLYSVHYAHAGAGELHLRPIINLKTEEGKKLFRAIGEEIADLVKKYRGSLSGEHGDGRLRGEFLPKMVGDKNYQLFRKIKRLWDPFFIFNPGKIVDTPPMDEMLRYEGGVKVPEIKTVFRFSNQHILQHAEQCNGSGDCRKLHLSGGTMCPSYMATRNEKDTTRGRANVLREFLTRSEKANRFDHQEILEVMDLCLSCKGCKSECPSNVDLAKLKSEFLQHYYESHRRPLRSILIGHYSFFAGLGARFPRLYNVFVSSWLPRFAGFSSHRVLPALQSVTLKTWYRQHRQVNGLGKWKVYFFCDEFTNYNDPHIGIKAIGLLEALGYQVIIPPHLESGRTWLSKGFVKRAQRIANRNIEILSTVVCEEAPLIGLEPSAILTVRDEYRDLANPSLQEKAESLASNCFLIDEFLAAAIDKGVLREELFTDRLQKIKLHGHCHQKALSSVGASANILAVPRNFTVETIPSGCCGMAGSFGLEKEHYEVSMKIGELVLFPAIRESEPDTLIVATGTSCRHQILDGTGRRAFHPVEVLYDALNEELKKKFN